MKDNLTLNSLPVTLSPTLDRLLIASVVGIAAVVTSVALIAVESILAELQLLLEQTESLIEILSVDLPQPRSIWNLLLDDSFCLLRIFKVNFEKRI